MEEVYRDATGFEACRRGIQLALHFPSSRIKFSQPVASQKFAEFRKGLLEWRSAARSVPPTADFTGALRELSNIRKVRVGAAMIRGPSVLALFSGSGERDEHGWSIRIITLDQQTVNQSSLMGRLEVGLQLDEVPRSQENRQPFRSTLHESCY